MTTNEKLAKLRQLMAEQNITVYYINTADPHQSEYVAEHYQTRAWLTGFTGSAGYAVVTQKEALLWVDGRYFIQAEKQIAGTEFKMMKIANSDYPTLQQWLIKHLSSGDTFGMNGEMVSQRAYEEFSELLGKNAVQVIADLHLVEDIWENRPAKPQTQVFVHDLKYAGKTPQEKLTKIRKRMQDDQAEVAIYAGLADICWMFNIRGDDVQHNPVTISYAMIKQDEAILYIDQAKLNQEVREFLTENQIKTKNYETVLDDVRNLNVRSIVLDKEKINHLLFSQIPSELKIIEKPDYPYMIKASLNEVELKNQRNCYIKDCVALTKFIYYIKQNVAGNELDELNVAKILHDLRAEQDLFLDDSFSTIAAYGINAPMMHYSASPESYSKIEPKGFLLVDSGGHYLDGTTDITRTISCGPLTAEQIRDYTLNLKSHINLAKAIFLYGVTGYYLDVLARQPLWQHYMDYKSGTGHGVGYLLSVHEGPQRFNMHYANVPLEEGMVITNEPGVYKENEYGIRLENDYVILKDKKVEADQFMKLDCLSFVPFDRAAIDVSLLEKAELNWLNDYHQEVFDKISPFLAEAEREWLRKETAALG